MHRSLCRTSRPFALAALVAVVLVCLLPAPALAYIPELEPGRASDSLGTSDSPYPDAVSIGGPDASRAVYGYLSRLERFDSYAFSVDEEITSEIVVLVPDEPAYREFRPQVLIADEHGIVALVEEEPSSERSHYFDTFAGMTFLRGAETEVTFRPGRRYVLVVDDGTGDQSEGAYVLLMSGPQRMLLASLIDIPKVHLGLYGQQPFKWQVAVSWLLALAALLALATWRRVRRDRDHPRMGPSDLFGL